MTGSLPETGNDCEPVFVVGMNGSGTSMMLDSLGRHPQLYAIPNETLMMPYIISRARRFGELSNSNNFQAYWQFAIDQMPVLVRFNDGVKPEIPSDWGSYPRTIAGVFDGIFSSLAKTKGKRRWCEKTPDHVQHVRLLSEVFPRSRFIHMIRDGREVACSIARRQFRHPELVIYRWKKLVNLGQADGAMLGERYMELKYEDLTSDPRSEMARVCEFLSLDFDEHVLSSRMPQSPKRKSLTKGELGAISANPMKWPQYFDSRSVKRLEQISGATLSHLGYRVENATGDRAPSRIHREIWRAIEFVRLTRKKMNTSKNYDSWIKVARNSMFSIKQYRSKRH